jgi:hypothetical protein
MLIQFHHHYKKIFVLYFLICLIINNYCTSHVILNNISNNNNVNLTELTFNLTNNSISKNLLVKKYKRDTSGASVGGFGDSFFQSSIFKLGQTQLIDSFEKLQNAMKQKNLECMPQSVFYNGTCIYISSKHQKLSWKHAERFCRKLPLNTTFLVIQNEHKYQFIRRAIIKMREKEKPSDQLVFYAGFNYSRSKDI